jgi:hypothetical protein
MQDASLHGPRAGKARRLQGLRVEKRLGHRLTMRFAPPRAARAPEYTAPMARLARRCQDGVGRCMAESVRARRRVANLRTLSAMLQVR